MQFSRLIGDDRYVLGQLHSVAVDKDDQLIVMAYNGGLNQNMDTLRALAPHGTYSRMLIPFSANLAPIAVDYERDKCSDRKMAGSKACPTACLPRAIRRQLSARGHEFAVSREPYADPLSLRVLQSTDGHFAPQGGRCRALSEMFGAGCGAEC